MKIVGYVRGNNASDTKVQAVTAALGGTIATRTSFVEADLAIQWGAKDSNALIRTKEAGIPYIILENPVWGARSHAFTWAYNGLNRLGWTPKPPDQERDKPILQPWKHPEDGDITIFGQVEGDQSLLGEDVYEWMESVQSVLPGASIREHPKMLSRSEQAHQEPLEECFGRTSRAITLSSTVGSEAIIAGIPTVAQLPVSFAYDCAGHGLFDVRMPDRTIWLHELSWRHLSLSDIPRGYILSGYEEARDQVRNGTSRGHQGEAGS